MHCIWALCFCIVPSGTLPQRRGKLKEGWFRWTNIIYQLQGPKYMSGCVSLPHRRTKPLNKAIVSLCALEALWKMGIVRVGTGVTAKWAHLPRGQWLFAELGCVTRVSNSPISLGIQCWFETAVHLGVFASGRDVGSVEGDHEIDNRNKRMHWFLVVVSDGSSHGLWMKAWWSRNLLQVWNVWKSIKFIGAHLSNLGNLWKSSKYFGKWCIFCFQCNINPRPR